MLYACSWVRHRAEGCRCAFVRVLEIIAVVVVVVAAQKRWWLRCPGRLTDRVPGSGSRKRERGRGRQTLIREGTADGR